MEAKIKRGIIILVRNADYLWGADDLMNSELDTKIKTQQQYPADPIYTLKG